MLNKEFFFCNIEEFLLIMILIETVRTRQAKDEISFNDAYNPAAAALPHENPPFLPGFFVLKATINETEIAKYVSLAKTLDKF